ncbi:peptidoglycan-binding protein [Oricola sp.]|uniref:peptidoglycan-binding protein n=1 Tax=Oricola sp. TaxID=1979950 RepID=UPI0025CB82BF|nr:peptidoglycan-binding protein [Oricola sp.]MCI5078646.1 peptidoglycan-binding protein [Oricola sp.]
MRGDWLVETKRLRGIKRLLASALFTAMVAAPAAAQNAPADETTTDTAETPGVIDLAPNADTECVQGASCLLDVRIENLGDAAFAGAAGLRGRFDPAVTVESVDGEDRGLRCETTGEGSYECLGSALSIAAGDASHIQLVIDVPADMDATTISHTKEMIWPDDAVRDKSPLNDRHVSTIAMIDPAMLPAIDLSIANAASEDECVAGIDCHFTLTVTNNGPAIYDGSIVIAGEADPATATLTKTDPADWTCGSADGRFSCTSARLSLLPDDTRSLEIDWLVEDATGDTLTSCATVSRAVKSDVAAVQRALNEAGFNSGVADGIAGRRTRAAISAYQEANGLPVTGAIDAALLESLLDAEAPGDLVAGNDRACTTVQLAPPPADEAVQTSAE